MACSTAEDSLKRYLAAGAVPMRSAVAAGGFGAC